MGDYLFQTTLFWLSTALVFEFFLKKLTTHRVNRFWLVAMTVVGLVWPFLQKTVGGWLPETSMPAIVLPVFEVGGGVKPDPGLAFPLRLGQIFGLVWAGGFVVVLAGIFWGIRQLFFKIIKGEKAELPDGFWLIKSEATPRPFSFFRFIFVDKTLNINDLAAKQIIAHERAHGQLGHGFDLLFFEILRAFFWFHPFVYWAKKRLRDVHEFEADESVAGQFSRKQYGVLLLQSHAGEADRRPAVALTNSFFSSSIKSRIMMLSRKKSGANAGLNYFLMLPLGLFLLFFQQKEGLAQSASKFQKWKMTVVTDTVVTFDPATFIETVQFVKSGKAEKTDETGPAVFYKEGDEMPEYPGGQNAMMQFLAQNIKYPAEARKANLEGKVIIDFVVGKDGTLRDFSEVKASPSSEMYLEAERVMKMMPKWKPGRINGKPVAVQVTVPVMFKLD